MAIVNEEGQQRTFKNFNVRFSVRFSYLLFPFDIAELLDQLAKAGYMTIPRPLMMPARNIRLGAKGKIANKGDIEIDLDDERGHLGTTSSNPLSAISGLNEVLQLIKDNLNADLNEMAVFYEIIGRFDIETSKNPLEKIEQISEKSEYNRQFSQIFNEVVSNYTLRIVPQGRVPNQTEWFDITIEPDVVKPTSSYTVMVVYRSKDKSKIEKFLQELMQNMMKILNVIES